MEQESTVLYKEIDRIIRIVYKELSFNDHLYQSTIYDKSSLSQIDECFDLSSTSLRTTIKNKYLLLYPNNYNTNDLDFILNLVTQQLLDKYDSSNALYLIFLVTDSIICQGIEGIYIHFDDLLEWDGLINKVDIKLFIAAYLVSNHVNNDTNLLTSTLNHNNKRLYDIFKRIGLSENHMHLKASGYITDINWYSFIKCSLFAVNDYADFVRTEGVYATLVKSDKNVSEKVHFILKFKVIRLILEAKLAKYPLSDFDWIDIIMQVLLSDDMLQTIIEIRHLVDLEILLEEFKDAWSDFDNKGDVTNYASSELHFLKKMMILLSTDRNLEYHKVFLFIFNLYICGMTDLKFQFVQDNLGMGFAKFKEKEDNKSWFIQDKKSKEDVIRSVFHKYYCERYVKRIEFRIGPEETPDDYLKELSRMIRLNKKEHQLAESRMKKQGLETPAEIQFGLIIHFIKTLGISGETTVKTEETKRERIEHQTNILLETLVKINELSLVSEVDSFKHRILGIDTANYELENRPTLYSLYFRKIRQLAENSESLYATYHVGEEFSTLSNGIRAVDEVLTFCDYRSNDRLGHALALGINVADYYETKRKKVMCSIGDYLDDLVWMYSVLIEDNQYKEDSNLLFLKKEYTKYNHLLFDQSNLVSFADYFNFYFLRGDCPDAHIEYNEQMSYKKVCRQFEYKLNYKNQWHESAFMNDKARNLFLNYSFSEAFRNKFDQSIGMVVTPVFIHCLENVQQIIKRKVLKMRVFIESNPTSNKKISYVDQYIKLPSLNLNRKHIEDNNETRVFNLPISINTDDSSIFQTNLVNEYSLIASALIREGYNEESVYDYIESLAVASNIHSFVKH